jgi:hypothetical protein
MTPVASLLQVESDQLPPRSKTLSENAEGSRYGLLDRFETGQKLKRKARNHGIYIKGMGLRPDDIDRESLGICSCLSRRFREGMELSKMVMSSNHKGRTTKMQRTNLNQSGIRMHVANLYIPTT